MVLLFSAYKDHFTIIDEDIPNWECKLCTNGLERSGGKQWKCQWRRSKEARNFFLFIVILRKELKAE